MKNSMCNKFENHLDFFQRNPTLQNMITACIFSKVFSKKPDFAKYENYLHFVKGFFKEFGLSQNMKFT
jgi:hypothetical protein